tara:strand:- start:383 stop:607 length:225 start_codon:yes stop_codon:yes gene_type:complete
MVKITKDMLISKVIEKHPEVAPILIGYGLHCVGCNFSSFDTLKRAIKIHGMDKETFEMMLQDINTIVLEKPKEK